MEVFDDDMGVKPSRGRDGMDLDEDEVDLTLSSLRDADDAEMDTDTVDAEGDLVVTFIDIGQGSATLVECPEGEKILIDCGSFTSGEAREDIISCAKAFIERRTGGKLDYFIVSHPDEDHMNLASVVLADITIENFWCGGSKMSKYTGRGKTDFIPFMMKKLGKKANQFKEHNINGGEPYSEAPDSEKEQRLVKCEGSMEVFIVCANVKRGISSDGREMLSPSEGDRLSPGTEANCESVVVCLRFAGSQILVCADATFSTEAYILSETEWGQGDWLESYALAGGHHGSADSFSAGFLKAVSPSWIHFSADMNERYRHPTWEVISRVVQACPDIARERAFGPHGVVIGPDRQIGYDLAGKDLLVTAPFVKEVLDAMKNGNKDARTVLEEAADQILKMKDSPTWIWVSDLAKDRHDSLQGRRDSPGEDADESPAHRMKHRDDEDDDELTLILYWARWFDEFAAEYERLTSLKGEFEEYDAQLRRQSNKRKGFWDWSIIDYDLFTSVPMANKGVYWELTIPGDYGPPVTQQL